MTKRGSHVTPVSIMEPPASITATRANAPTETSGTRKPRARRRGSQAPPAQDPNGVRRREAKALDAGAQVEADIVKMLRRCGVDIWRRPGIRLQRLTMRGYKPDAAIYFPELAGILSEHTPQVDPTRRPKYHVIVEIKSQYSDGSCKEKIPGSIEHVAHISDGLNLPAIFILDFGDVISAAEVGYFKELGRMNSVLVLTKAEATKAALVEGVQRIHRQRTALLKNRLTPRGCYKPTKRPPLHEQGFSHRVSLRRQLRAPLIPLGHRR